MDNSKDQWQDINDSHKDGETWIVQNGEEGGFYTHPHDIGIAEWYVDERWQWRNLKNDLANKDRINAWTLKCYEGGFVRSSS